MKLYRKGEKMKPFNLKEARLGKPIVTRAGRKVELLPIVLEDVTYPVLAIINKDSPETYTEDGYWIEGGESSRDLSMADCPDFQGHVDDFIDGNYRKDCYARWILNHFRLPAALQIDFAQFMVDRKLFCDYKGERYRCTGASRLGDVWLTLDFNRSTGYDLRVEVTGCNNWGERP